MTAEIPVADIERFRDWICDPGILRIGKPFWDAGELFVTDARILVAFHLDAPPDGMDCIRKVDGTWIMEDKKQCPPNGHDIVRQIPGVGTSDVPVVGGPPKGSNALWEHMQVCGECEGLGYEECDLGHDHVCEYCGGKGKAMCVSEEAGDRVVIGGVEFQRRYIWIISQLPGVKLCEPSETKLMGFTFDGGRGCLMGLADEE